MNIFKIDDVVVLSGKVVQKESKKLVVSLPHLMTGYQLAKWKESNEKLIVEKIQENFTNDN